MPLFLDGAEQLASYPYSTITDGMALNITVCSYNGHLDWGIVVDRDIVPDPWAMFDGIIDAQPELLDRVTTTASTATTGRAGDRRGGADVGGSIWTDHVAGKVVVNTDRAGATWRGLPVRRRLLVNHVIGRRRILDRDWCGASLFAEREVGEQRGVVGWPIPAPFGVVDPCRVHPRGERLVDGEVVDAHAEVAAVPDAMVPPGEPPGPWSPPATSMSTRPPS